MPKPTRAARSRATARRRTSGPPLLPPISTGGASSDLFNAIPAEPPTAPPTPVMVSRAARPAAPSRAIITDYGYVVAELRRICLITAVIVIGLVVLAFFIN